MKIPMRRFIVFLLIILCELFSYLRPQLPVYNKLVIVLLATPYSHHNMHVCNVHYNVYESYRRSPSPLRSGEHSGNGTPIHIKLGERFWTRCDISRYNVCMIKECCVGFSRVRNSLITHMLLVRGNM